MFSCVHLGICLCILDHLSEEPSSVEKTRRREADQFVILKLTKEEQKEKEKEEKEKEKEKEKAHN